MQDLLNKCPKCESEDIFYNIEASKAILEMDDTKITALKLIDGSESQTEISCKGCGSQLIPTINGFRLSE